jgi:hypothetical protein
VVVVLVVVVVVVVAIHWSFQEIGGIDRRRFLERKEGRNLHYSFLLLKFGFLFYFYFFGIYSLATNHIGEDGARCIAKMLCNNQNIVNLA